MSTAIRRQQFGNEVFDYICDWIMENLEPDDIFSDDQLEDWAEANDWIKQP